MSDAPEIKTKEDAQKAIPTRNYMDIFNPGYILAGMATLASAVLSITRSSHKYFEDTPAFKALEDAKNERVNYALINADADLTHEIHEANKEYRQGVKGLLEGSGGRGRIGNILNEWKALETHNKLQVGLTFAAVAFVAMGAVYSYTRQSRLTDKLHQRIIEHHDKQQEQHLG